MFVLSGCGAAGVFVDAVFLGDAGEGVGYFLSGFVGEVSVFGAEVGVDGGECGGEVVAGGFDEGDGFDAVDVCEGDEAVDAGGAEFPLFEVGQGADGDAGLFGYFLDVQAGC